MKFDKKERKNVLDSMLAINLDQNFVLFCFFLGIRIQRNVYYLWTFPCSMVQHIERKWPAFFYWILRVKCLTRHTFIRRITEKKKDPFEDHQMMNARIRPDIGSKLREFESHWYCKKKNLWNWKLKAKTTIIINMIIVQWPNDKYLKLKTRTFIRSEILNWKKKHNKFLEQ